MNRIELIFREYLPPPFSIAVILAFIAMALAFLFTSSAEGSQISKGL